MRNSVKTHLVYRNDRMYAITGTEVMVRMHGVWYKAVFTAAELLQPNGTLRSIYGVRPPILVNNFKEKPHA